MIRRHLSALVTLCCLLAGLPLSGQENRATLPTIRQVWLDSKEAPSLLGKGSWSFIPKDEFDKTLKLAEQRSQAERQLPWLTSARYEAKVQGLKLEGTAELLLTNPHALSAWAKLSPWSLPIKTTDQSQPLEKQGFRAVNERSLGLLIEPGLSTPRKLAWSLQGEERSDGRWFTLQLPPCPQATLQIEVPTPYRLDWPAVRQHLKGPLPSESTGFRKWLLQIGGEARQDVQFVVREPFQERLQPWTEARLDADYIVGTQDVQARYEIDLQRWHDRLRGVTIDLPSGLTVRTVTIRQPGGEVAAAWQVPSPNILTVTLPESVEQRAILLLEGQWALKANERVRFLVPGLQGVTAVRPTLRIVTRQGQPLEDWQWGDYYPAQAPQRDPFSDSPAELLTLYPRVILRGKLLETPSARLAVPSQELTYLQDSWWQIGSSSSQLLVKATVSATQGQHEYLSWQTPAGWQVKDVTVESGPAMVVWTWHAGKPLVVQLDGGVKQGIKSQIGIRLEPTLPWAITTEPKTVAIPQMVPTLPGNFAGNYAITLERRGMHHPPSMTVLQPPGEPLSTPLERVVPWTKTQTLPDSCWQQQSATSAGSVVLQEWPASLQAQVETQIKEDTTGMRVEYHVRLQPVAGKITRWPMKWTSPVPELSWKGTTSVGGEYQSTGPQSGEFVWTGELENTVELVATVPWSPDQPLPLLTSPELFEGKLRLSKAWKIKESGSGSPLVATGTTDDFVFTYGAASHSPLLERRQLTELSIRHPMVTTTILGDVAVSEYRCEVTPHPEPVTLRLPSQTVLVSWEVDGVLHPAGSELSLAASEKPQAVTLLYRSVLRSQLGISQWQPLEPQWNVPTTQAVHQLNTGASVLSLWGTAREQWGSFSRGLQLTGQTNSVVWISRQFMIVLVGLAVVLSWKLASLSNRAEALGILLLAACIVLLLPQGWWVLAAGLAVGVLFARAHAALWKKSLRPAIGGVAASLIALGTGQVLAQPEKPVELVYLLIGNKDRGEQTQVMVSTTLWQQMQKLAGSSAAGSDQAWYLVSAQTEGKLEKGKLRLVSTWEVRVDGSDTVDIPWPGQTAPVETQLDGKMMQAKLQEGPFGLQQLTLPVPGRGSHTLRLVWDCSVKQSAQGQAAEVKLPGAPSQGVRIEGLPDGTLLQGSTGSWLISDRRLEAEAGLARSILLSWPNTTLERLQGRVDVGVLWEHRTYLSVAHAVLAYHIDTGRLSEIEIELPAKTRVKSLSVVGEVTAAVQPRVRQWKVTTKEGKQRLRVVLQRPVTGTVHVLLELPWMREAESTSVPLVGVQPIDWAVGQSFVAWLADGVQARPLSPLSPVLTQEYAFALPWLPSLSSLPHSSISSMNRLGEQPVQMELSPINQEPDLKTRLEVTIDGREASYTYHVESREQQPALVLQGKLDAGLVISEVKGEQVLRWHQTSLGAGQPSQVTIWFQSKTSGSRAELCTILARKPVEAGKHVPLFQIRWAGVAKSGIPVILRSIGSGKASIEQWPTGLTALCGPFLDEQAIAGGDMLPELAAGAIVALHGESLAASTQVQARWERGIGPSNWQLVLSAEREGLLPMNVHFVAKDGRFIQNWHVEAGVPSSVRPIQGQGKELAWSVQLSKPVKRLVIKCNPLTDAAGKMVLPTVIFPAWPGLAVVRPEM